MQIDQRNAREHESATFDENRRAAGMPNEPYARQKIKARTEGENGRHV